jgi:hypothetical protein
MRMLHWKKQGFCINTIFFTRRHIGTSSMRHTILNCGPLRLQCSIAEGASSIIRADAPLLLPSLICRSSYLPSHYCTLVREERRPASCNSDQQLPQRAWKKCQNTSTQYRKVFSDAAAPSLPISSTTAKALSFDTTAKYTSSPHAPREIFRRRTYSR